MEMIPYFVPSMFSTLAISVGAVFALAIALEMADSLKPLRDFFLVLYFFSIGAEFDKSYLPVIILPATMLALIIGFLKPLVFRQLLSLGGEMPVTARELGWRLGQGSEFSLMLVALAAKNGMIDHELKFMIQAATILSFLITSYIVVKKYPTPLNNLE